MSTTDRAQIGLALGYLARAMASAMMMACGVALTPITATAQDVSAAADSSCPLSQPSAPRAVTGVIDSETLQLDDGSRVRLIGAMGPQAADTGERADLWPPQAEAQRLLATLAHGRTVTLAYAGRQRDRHGRHLAHVFVAGGETGPIWLQGAMLEAGQARAYGIPDNFACLDALLAAEARARRQRIGIWSNAAYGVRSARRTFELLRLAGTYQIVEGRLVKASRSKSGRLYLNFGNDWRSDFSIVVASPLSRSEPTWAASLLDLAGRRVRVRGWMGRRNGPMVEVEHKSQIEILGPVTGTGEANGVDGAEADERRAQPGAHAPSFPATAGPANADAIEH